MFEIEHHDEPRLAARDLRLDGERVVRPAPYLLAYVELHRLFPRAAFRHFLAIQKDRHLPIRGGVQHGLVRIGADAEGLPKVAHIALRGPGPGAVRPDPLGGLGKGVGGGEDESGEEDGEFHGGERSRKANESRHGGKAQSALPGATPVVFRTHQRA